MPTVHRAEPDPDAPVRTVPVRTCVGCRVRAARTGLVRIVLDQGRAVPDLRGGMPGRGAWLHADLECLDQAERRRAIARALHAQGPVDLGAVRQHLQQHQAQHD